MKLIISPGKPLHGSICLPGDKSLSHRAALFAALAQGQSRIENFLVSGVTRAMLDALTALNVSWQLQGTALLVEGQGLEGLRAGTAPGRPVQIHCGNSATTMRLLAGALAAAGIPAVLDGTPGLRRRPMKRIVEPLQRMGVNIESLDGRAPLVLHRSSFPLKPLDYSLPVASAQVKSCLLLASLAARGPATLVEPGLSRDHTERMLHSMGVKIVSQPASPGFATRLFPPHPLTLKPLSLRLPGDISSAAFLIVAALITPGSEILLEDVGLNPTRTGLLDALKTMGAAIQVSPTGERGSEPVGNLVVRHSQLHGTRVSASLVVRMIDEFPAFAVAAAFAAGETIVSQAEELRHKESDRITALCQGLRALGIDAQEKSDGFLIPGGETPLGGTVGSQGDHRLAMALGVVGLAAQGPVIVQGAEIITESFPEFTDALHALGARIEVQS